MIVITNRSAKEALALYRERWLIECCFKAFKSSGFDLEATGLRDKDRLATLVQLVSIAYLWCVRLGLYVHKSKPIRTKTHGRKAISIFRLGLDTLREAIVKRHVQPNLLDNCIRVLSCT